MQGSPTISWPVNLSEQECVLLCLEEADCAQKLFPEISGQSCCRLWSLLNWVTHRWSHHRFFTGAIGGSSALPPLPPSPHLALRRGAEGQTRPQRTTNGGGRRGAKGQTHTQRTTNGGGKGHPALPRCRPGAWGLLGRSCHGRAAPKPWSWAGHQAHRVKAVQQMHCQAWGRGAAGGREVHLSHKLG